MQQHVNVLDWHVHPFRADRWYELWRPGLERAAAYGATEWSLTRAEEDPLHFTQTTIWSDREDFQRYWMSDEVAAIREQILDYYNKPLLPTWHQLIASA